MKKPEVDDTLAERCPKCGSTKWSVSTKKSYDVKWYSVRCSKCGFYTVWSDDKDDAIDTFLRGDNK